MTDCLVEDAMTARMFLEMGFFPSADVAQTVLRNGRRKRRWRANGTSFLKGEGHPEIVWSKGWVVRAGQEDHELLITYVRYAINATESWRHDLDEKLRPDLMIRMRNGRHKDLTCYLEVDMNQTGYDRIVEDRYKPFADANVTCPVLWVVHGDTPKAAEMRMNGLRKRAESIKGIAFFTTTYKLLDNPAADVFVDFNEKPWGLGKGNGPLIGKTIGQLIVKGIGKPW